jgi:hypothetical protein
VRVVFRSSATSVCGRPRPESSRDSRVLPQPEGSACRGLDVFALVGTLEPFQGR